MGSRKAEKHKGETVYLSVLGRESMGSWLNLISGKLTASDNQDNTIKNNHKETKRQQKLLIRASIDQIQWPSPEHCSVNINSKGC